MKKYSLEVSEDEALVLFEFFSRFDDTDEMNIENAAEYAALARLSAQLDKTTAAAFDPAYKSLLQDAQRRLAERVGNTWPGAKTSD